PCVTERIWITTAEEHEPRTLRVVREPVKIASRRPGIADLSPRLAIPLPGIGEERDVSSESAKEKHLMSSCVVAHRVSRPPRGTEIADLRPVRSVPQPSVSQVRTRVVAAEQQRSLCTLVVRERVSAAGARTYVLALSPKQRHARDLRRSSIG